ncbi:hypothetical protein H109_02301 [Trichophyton interdigitale MR816]|uniref:Uncharacterized protein n=1 Tax=Trichophyton interdigitale (strain MR816) TaxID=1215338 RepID=A0A059JDY4_TRIIM|nr:hypothetical protein H109_02301 [Trichophyton interdigitale MR816]
MCFSSSDRDYAPPPRKSKIYNQKPTHGYPKKKYKNYGDFLDGGGYGDNSNGSYWGGHHGHHGDGGSGGWGSGDGGGGAGGTGGGGGDGGGGGGGGLPERFCAVIQEKPKSENL